LAVRKIDQLDGLPHLEQHGRLRKIDNAEVRLQNRKVALRQLCQQMI
jgi:hypothetical protein